MPRRRYRLESPSFRPMSRPTDERSKRHRSVVANPIPVPPPRPEREYSRAERRIPPVPAPVIVRRRSQTPPPEFLLHNLLQSVSRLFFSSSRMRLVPWTLDWRSRRRRGLFAVDADRFDQSRMDDASYGSSASVREHEYSIDRKCSPISSCRSTDSSGLESRRLVCR